MTELDLSSLNPGIRKTVEFLRDNDFNTIDSGDGEQHVFECDQIQPYVHISVYPSFLVGEADRLLRVLEDKLGIVVESMDEDNLVPFIEAHYNPADKIATITLWNVKL